MNKAQQIIEWYEELCCEMDTIEEANEEFFERCDDEGAYLKNGYEFKDGSMLLIDTDGWTFKAVAVGGV